MLAASPLKPVLESDLLPGVLALERLSLAHHLAQTERALAFSAACTASRGGGDAGLLARYVARLYAASEDAWRAVCDARGLDYSAQLARLETSSLVSHLTFAGMMRSEALTDEQCAALSERLPGPAPTVEGQRRMYEELVEGLTFEYTPG